MLVVLTHFSSICYYLILILQQFICIKVNLLNPGISHLIPKHYTASNTFYQLLIFLTFHFLLCSTNFPIFNIPNALFSYNHHYINPSTSSMLLRSSLLRFGILLLLFNLSHSKRSVVDYTPAFLLLLHQLKHSSIRV